MIGKRFNLISEKKLGKTYDAILKLVSHNEFEDFEYKNHKNRSSVIFDLKGTWKGKNVISM